MDTTKIIKGVVGGGKYTVTSPIVKEDYGLYLLIEGLELPSTYEVDFSNSEHNGTSVTMIGNADGVLIPRQFITTGKDVFAFLYHVGADYGRTVYKFRIPNKLRPDRTDDEPTPEEQSTIDQCISALNTAVAQTAQDVIDADASAQSASDDADRAEQAKNDASTFAQRSAQSAQASADYSESAQASASASANSASQSAQIKEDVESMVDDAQGYASASAQSATASANSASQASASATSASQSASSASGYATSAQTSAQTASTKASEASTSASTASAKATEASQSASQALTYKTDAETAKTASQTAQGLAESAMDSAQGYASDAQGYANDAQASAESISASASQIAQNTADILKAFPTDTASGAIASFTDGADDIPLKSLVVDIDPVQDLHGQDAPYPAGGGANKFDGLWNGETTAYNTAVNLIPVTPSETYYVYAPNIASSERVFGVFYDADGQALGTRVNLGRNTTFTVPADAVSLRLNVWNTLDVTNIAINYPSTVTTYSPYENICPISGWTGMQFQKTGVNIWNGTLGNDVFVPFPTKVGVQYSVSAKMVDSTQNTYLYVRKRTVGDTSTGTIFKYIITGKTVTPQAFTAEAGYEYGLWSNAKYTNVTDIQIEVSSTTTAYEPYNGTTIPISWQSEAGTVYGGKLDVLSGVLRVDRAMLDMSTASWTLRDDTHRALTFDIQNLIKIPSSQILTSGSIAENYTEKRASASLMIGTYAIMQTGAVMLYYDGVNAPSGKLVYPLATPIEIQLTPHEVNSLLGTNNIFADTGDTEVVYRADTKLFIERLTEPDADMIADSNIVSGQYFMVGNNLYKATANIASGSAVIVGTNAIRKSLSEALNEINA